MTVEHNAEDLVRLFNNLFGERYRCHLVPGRCEPLYQPTANNRGYHQLQFVHDYFASALHEIAHWCLAGERRLQQVDYGYWYAGRRDQAMQKKFESVEVLPQALEWVFSDAARFRFSPSLDNLELQPDPAPFLVQVQRAKINYLANGLPERGEQFRRTLETFYGDPD